MLVDNKFIFISLPRSASTSFFITCLRNDINVRHYDNIIGLDNVKIDKSMDNESIADSIMHAHERLTSLEKKFGNTYDIISVKRDRHERFVSLWKHVIDETHRIGDYNLFEKFKNMNADDLLFYNSEELLKSSEKIKIFKKILSVDDTKNIHPQILTMLNILISPTTDYHNNDPRIIWFDFNKLYELEKWVSNKLGVEFKLEYSNSSKHFHCNLKLDDIFITKYNDIYDIYDITKINKTLI